MIVRVADESQEIQGTFELASDEIFSGQCEDMQEFRHERVGYQSECSSRSPKDRADADENQVANCDHDRKFDNQHGDAEENLDDAEGDAGGG